MAAVAARSSLQGAWVAGRGRPSRPATAATAAALPRFHTDSRPQCASFRPLAPAASCSGREQPACKPTPRAAPPSSAERCWIRWPAYSRGLVAQVTTSRRVARPLLEGSATANILTNRVYKQRSSRHNGRGCRPHPAGGTGWRQRTHRLSFSSPRLLFPCLIAGSSAGTTALHSSISAKGGQRRPRQRDAPLRHQAGAAPPGRRGCCWQPCPQAHAAPALPRGSPSWTGSHRHQCLPCRHLLVRRRGHHARPCHRRRARRTDWRVAAAQSTAAAGQATGHVL